MITSRVVSSRMAPSRRSNADRSNGVRRTNITGSPYDSDSDVSFVRPCDRVGPNASRRRKSSRQANPERSYSSRITKKLCDSDIADVSFVLPLPDLIDRISTDANHFGHSLALRANVAIQTFVASDIESSGEDSDGPKRTTSHARKVVLLMEKAGRCVASLQAVNPCLGLLQDEEVIYSSSDETRHKHKRVTRKKKASEAKPHGKMLDNSHVLLDSFCHSRYSLPRRRELV